MENRERQFGYIISKNREKAHHIDMPLKTHMSKKKQLNRIHLISNAPCLIFVLSISENL